MAIVEVSNARDFIGADTGDVKIIEVLCGIVERAAKQFLRWDPERAAHTRYYPKTERGGDTDSTFPGDFGVVSRVGGTSNILCLDHKYVLASGLEVREHAGAYGGQAATFSSSDVLTVGTQYVLDTDDGSVSASGHLKRVGGHWPRTRHSVRVVYTAGFSAQEFLSNTSGATDYTDAGGIRDAVLLGVMHNWQQHELWKKDAAFGGPGPKASETIVGDYSYTAGAMMQRLLGLHIELPRASLRKLQPFRSYRFAT